MIQVLLFAELQEKTGKAKIKLKAGHMTVTELKDVLMDKYGIKQPDKVMVAINEDYAEDEDWIQPGDTVAFLPPVSGG